MPSKSHKPRCSRCAGSKEMDTAGRWVCPNIARGLCIAKPLRRVRNAEEKEVGSYLSYREVSDGVVRATKGRIDVYAIDPLRMPGYGRKRGAR